MKVDLSAKCYERTGSNSRAAKDSDRTRAMRGANLAGRNDLLVAGGGAPCGLWQGTIVSSLPRQPTRRWEIRSAAPSKGSVFVRHLHMRTVSVESSVGSSPVVVSDPSGRGPVEPRLLLPAGFDRDRSDIDVVALAGERHPCRRFGERRRDRSRGLQRKSSKKSPRSTPPPDGAFLAPLAHTSIDCAAMICGASLIRTLSLTLRLGLETRIAAILCAEDGQLWIM